MSKDGFGNYFEWALCRPHSFHPSKELRLKHRTEAGAWACHSPSSWSRCPGLGRMDSLSFPSPYRERLLLLLRSIRPLLMKAGPLLGLIIHLQMRRRDFLLLKRIGLILYIVAIGRSPHLTQTGIGLHHLNELNRITEVLNSLPFAGAEQKI